MACEEGCRKGGKGEKVLKEWRYEGRKNGRGVRGSSSTEKSAVAPMGRNLHGEREREKERDGKGQTPKEEENCGSQSTQTGPGEKFKDRRGMREKEYGKKLEFIVIPRNKGGKKERSEKILSRKKSDGKRNVKRTY